MAKRKKKTVMLTAAMQVMIRGERETVENLVGEFKGRGVGEDELQSVANEALCDCAMRYNARSGASFTTYLTHRVRGALTNCINNECHPWNQQGGRRVFVKMLSMDYTYNDEEDGEITMGDMIADESPAEQEHQERHCEVVEELLSCLKDDERELMVKKYGLDGERDGLRKLRKRKYGHLSDKAFNKRCERIEDKMRRYAMGKNMNVLV